MTPTFPGAFSGIHQWAYLSEALSRLDRWKALTSGMYELSDLRGSTIGNPFGIKIGGVLISNGAEHQHYGAQRIAAILTKDDAIVAEIGGGYGAMAYYLLRDSPRITYCNFDLPESLALAAYYLIYNFPQKRILLCGESSWNTDVRDYDIALLPLTELSRMPHHFADLTFSAHAMSDLRADALKAYLKEINHMTKYSFLYQGMHTAAKSLRQQIANEYPSLSLKQEKQYYLHGQDGQDHLQHELLYEMNSSQRLDTKPS